MSGAGTVWAPGRRGEEGTRTHSQLLPKGKLAAALLPGAQETLAPEPQ